MQKVLASNITRIIGSTLLALGYIFRNHFSGIPNHEKIAAALSLMSLIVIALYAYFSRRIPVVNLLIMLLIAVLFLALPNIFDI